MFIIKLLLNILITLVVFFVLWEMLTREIDVQPKLKPLIMVQYQMTNRF